MATTKPKILLVDKADFLLDMERDFLAQTPAEILTAGNGTEALRQIRQELPQLVYLDVELPDISGTECCRQIKVDPTLRQTPIVLIFASARDLAVDAMELYGCDEVLAKPLERKSFLNCGYRYLLGIERRNKRIPCHIPIHCQFEHHSLMSNAIDVSDNGVYIQSPIPVLPGTEITVSFNIPAGDTVVEGHGRVAWVNQGTQRSNIGMPQGFGVNLLHISPTAIPHLLNFVNSKSDQEATRRENELTSLDRSQEAPAANPDRDRKLPPETKKENGLSEH